MKKRSLILSILCVVLAISMTSCAKDDDSSSQGFHGVEVVDESNASVDGSYDTEIKTPATDNSNNENPAVTNVTTTLSPRDTRAGEVITTSSLEGETDSTPSTTEFVVHDEKYYETSIVTTMTSREGNANVIYKETDEDAWEDYVYSDEAQQVIQDFLDGKYTEAELLEKLKQAGVPEQVAERDAVFWREAKRYY